jgi:hypothetical protein
MTDYALVLATYYPGLAWSMSDNDYDTLVIHDGSTKPSKAKLDAKAGDAQTLRKTIDIEAQRRARYQAETDGMFFEAQRDGTPLTAWQAAVDQIKADLPYPSEAK